MTGWESRILTADVNVESNPMADENVRVDSLTGCESWILADDVNVESNPMADENVGVDSLTGCESPENPQTKYFSL